MASRIVERVMTGKWPSTNLPLEEAVSLFHHLLNAINPEPTIDYFDTLLVTISHMKHPKRYHTIVSLFNCLNQSRRITYIEVSPSIHTFEAAMNACCLMSRVDLRFIVLAQLFRSGFSMNPVIFGSLIRGLCIEKQFGDASKMFDKMFRMGYNPNLIMYNTLIDGLCSNGNTKLGLQVYEEIERGGEPDVVTYNTLINGLCKEGNISMAIKVFEEVFAQGAAPNVLTYSTLIDGLCKSGDFVGAMNLFEEMLENGVDPDVITYNILISGQCREGVGNMDKAFELFNGMVRLGLAPDVFTYKSLILAYGRHRKFGIVGKLLEQMVENGVKDYNTYSLTICDLSKNGHWKDAIRILSKMRNNGFEPCQSTLDSLADSLCDNGQIYEAKEILILMAERGGPTMFTGYKVLNGFITEGHLNEAVELMVKNYIRPDYYCLKVLTSAYCKCL